MSTAKKRRAAALGSVVFADRASGKCKCGIVLPDGRIWHEKEGTFENTLDWLDGAPFQEPSQTMKNMEEVAKLAAIAAMEEAGPLEHAPQGRRRSRSVQSPPGHDISAESVFALKSLDSEWNDWYQENENSAVEMEGKYGSDFIMATRLVFGTKCNRISLFQGNPSSLSADAIVRSTGPSLVETNRGEFWDLALQRAGIRLMLNLENILEREGNHGKIDPGIVVATPAFDLPPRHILHVVTPSEPVGADLLEQYYTSVFEKAQEENFSSVILPFIGDGEHCSAEQSARAMVSVLQKGCLDVDSSFWDLDRVVLVCATENDMNVLRLQISAAAQHTSLFSFQE